MKHLAICTSLILLFCVDISAQNVQQITSSESNIYDSYFESLFVYEEQPFYSVYVNDRVEIRELDTGRLMHTSSFEMCEEEIIDWKISKESIVYASYNDLVIENWTDGSISRYTLRPNEENDLGERSLDLALVDGIVITRLYPGPETIQFDLRTRKVTSLNIVNIQFVTDQYIYYLESNNGIRTLKRYNRDTEEVEIVVDGFIRTGSIIHSNTLYINKNDSVICLLDISDNITTHEFRHEGLLNVIQLNNGNYVFLHYSDDGAQLTTISKEEQLPVSSNILDLNFRIKIIDAYNQDLYVENSNREEESIGVIKFPYTSIEVLQELPLLFTKVYTGKIKSKLLVEQNSSGLERVLYVIDKENYGVQRITLRTSNLFLGDILRVVDSESGFRIVASEETGKVVYRYVDETNDLERVTQINHRRGLGTAVQQNGDSYLIADEHSLHERFEYIDPISKELEVHEVDGVIHGQVVPYEGNYFYLRNQNYQDVDEDFSIDIVSYNPSSKEATVLLSGINYRRDNVSFSNLNFTQSRFGFLSLYSTDLLLDLRDNTFLNLSSDEKRLMRFIYHETEDYFYSFSNDMNRSHIRISKEDYSIQEEILISNSARVLTVNESSFVLLGNEEAYYIDNEAVRELTLPSGYRPQWRSLVGNDVILWGFNGSQSEIRLYNILSDESTLVVTDGFFLDKIGDFIIGTNTFSSPFEYVSIDILSGEKYFKNSNSQYNPIYKTDTSVYIYSRDNQSIEILNSKLEDTGLIASPELKDASWQIISPSANLPVLLKIERPNIEENFREKADYSLGVLEPEDDSFQVLFSCNDDLRFNTFFEWDSVSTVLLRNEETGYQIYDWVLDGFRSEITSILPDEGESTIMIYPNPTSGALRISQVVQKAVVYNALGQAIDEYTNTRELDLSEMAPAVYYLELMTQDGIKSVQKVQLNF